MLNSAVHAVDSEMTKLSSFVASESAVGVN